MQTKTDAEVAASRLEKLTGGEYPILKSRASLMSLPVELHLAIADHLPFPDALSLKYVNRHFNCFVDTGIDLKIEWLMERRRLHLECPNDRKCDLGSDLRFCRGSVPLLMKRRRQHFECESKPGLGCLVYGTPQCAHKPKRLNTWHHWFRVKLTIELWWLLAALLPLLLCYFALALR